jgi:nitrate reductase beta subunit
MRRLLNRLNSLSEPWQPSPKVKPQPLFSGKASRACSRFKRAETVDGVVDTRALEEVGLSEAQAQEMYRYLAIANYEDRFVVPSSHREQARDAFPERIASIRFSASSTGWVSPAVSRFARYWTGIRRLSTSGRIPEAAQQSPVYKMAMDWKLALPLHPEYRTLPMVWYVPPLSPIQSAADAVDGFRTFEVAHRQHTFQR